MKTVAKLKLIEFIDGMFFANIVINLFAISQGVSLSNAVIAQSIFAGTVFLSEIPTGFIADKFGRKISMSLGYFLNAFGLIAIILSPTTLGLYAMNVIRAIGTAMVSGANEALLFEASKEEGLDYKKQSSIVTSNGIAGLAFAGLVAAVVYGVFGAASYIPLILVTSASQLFITFFSLTLKDTSRTLRQESVVKEEVRLFSSLTKTFHLMRSNKTIFALTMIGLLATCNEYFLYGTYGPHFEASGVANFWVGAAFSIGLLINFVLQRYAYLIENYLTFEKAFALIKALSILGYFGLALATQSQLIVILIISTIGVFNLERPIVSDYANQEIENSVRGTVLSGMSLASRMMKMILTFLLGLIIAGGSLKLGYFTQASFMTVGLVISYWLLVAGSLRVRQKVQAASLIRAYL
jgi:MFS family permease